MAKSSVNRAAIVLFNNSDTFTRRLVRRGSTLRLNFRCDQLVLAKCAVMQFELAANNRTHDRQGDSLTALLWLSAIQSAP